MVGKSCAWVAVWSKQGLHRLEKYLNIQDCLAKSLKIKFALKENKICLEKYFKNTQRP